VNHAPRSASSRWTTIPLARNPHPLATARDTGPLGTDRLLFTLYTADNAGSPQSRIGVRSLNVRQLLLHENEFKRQPIWQREDIGPQAAVAAGRI